MGPAAGNLGDLKDPEAGKIRACLAKILSCPLFAQAERQQKFLSYVVEQTLAGRGDRLKGYSIGAEVFERSDDFDPQVNAIVRVEASRLRAKLREYYDSEGRGDAVRIDLPKGGYVPQFRFQSEWPEPGSALAAHVAKLTPVISVPADQPSLAVLPFENLGSDPEQDYFADGITEDLITALSKLSGLLVISRHSVFSFKGVAKDAREIAAELGVRYLLEGSVRRAGNRVRITAQLVEAETGVQAWADSYDRDLEDIFAVQDDVTRRIVETLEVNLGELDSSSLVHAGTTSMEAHDFLLRGLERHWEYTPDSIQAAEGYFAKAIERDPDYAAAHAWLARTAIYRYATCGAGRESLELADRHARKAMTLGHRLPLSYSIFGWVQLWRGNAVEALGAARRAVAMDPNNADAYLFLSIILSSANRAEEGLQMIQKAMRLNPQPSAFYLFALLHAYFTLGRYEEAIEAGLAGKELRFHFIPTREYLAISYFLLDRKDEAEAERDEVLEEYRTGGAGVRTIYLDKHLVNRFREMRRALGLPVILDEER